MILATTTYLFACLKDPGYVQAPHLDTYFCGVPGRQTTGHVSLQEISFDFKAFHLKQLSAASNLHFSGSTLPSPKYNDPSETNRRQVEEPERFAIVDTVTPAIAAYSVNIGGNQIEASGPIEERQLDSDEAAIRNVNESNTTYSGEENDESQAIEDHEEDEGGQEIPQTETTPEKPERPTSDEIIVETRYCIVCQLEQPLRGKHCKECNKCVLLHDHHCPWLGNCVGERNRLVFYWYLVAQTAELLMALFCMWTSLESADNIMAWVETNILRLIVVLVILFFIVMVSSLLGFHSYLAVTNQTTCKVYTGEYASWDRISYLKAWPQNYGSPFSKGLSRNLKMYCCEALKSSPRKWRMPTSVPDHPPKRSCIQV